MSDIDEDTMGWVKASKPIAHMLGQQYDLSSQAADFFREFTGLIWFSYRSGMPDIVTDAGWGCMIRCGQMMLAEAMKRALVEQGRDMRATSERRELIKLFLDKPEAPYSIHNITSKGSALVGKGVKDWFGPNAIAQVIRALVAEDPDRIINAHVAMDGCVCLQDLRAYADDWRPLLLLIPLRLGLAEMNESYVDQLQALFKHAHTVGAVGGKPNSAYYFVGARGDETIYLDPHILQQVVPLEDELFNLKSYSFSKTRSMNLAGADPSICVGFMFPTLEEMEMSLQEFKEGNSSSKVSLFAVVEKNISLSDDLVNALAFDDEEEDDEDDDGFAVIDCL